MAVETSERSYDERFVCIIVKFPAIQWKRYPSFLG